MIISLALVIAAAPIDALNHVVFAQTVKIIKPSKRAQVVQVNAVEVRTQTTQNQNCTQCDALTQKEKELGAKEAALNAKANELEAKETELAEKDSTASAQNEKKKKNLRQLEKQIEQTQAQFNEANSALSGE
jgi:septal ring factor EnvC (AmiA/AmiB activator)